MKSTKTIDFWTSWGFKKWMGKPLFSKLLARRTNVSIVKNSVICAKSATSFILSAKSEFMLNPNVHWQKGSFMVIRYYVTLYRIISDFGQILLPEVMQ
jgi:hypothetical protein